MRPLIESSSLKLFSKLLFGSILNTYIQIIKSEKKQFDSMYD